MRFVRSTTPARHIAPRERSLPKLIELLSLAHFSPSRRRLLEAPRRRRLRISSMATRSEAPDLAVDELRRRARRRLIGAIILALAAAVLLPLLLENEPKPLGDDVSIQIPPIDNEKFINPLSSGKAQDPKAKGSIAMGKNGVSAVAPAADAPAVVPPVAGAKASEQPPSGNHSNSSAPTVTARRAV